jgi:anti-anti-sigma regulatory factor
LTGRLAARHVDDLRAAVMILIANNNYTVVNLDEVTAMDPVCLQFFCMAIGVARSLGKKVILRGKDALLQRQGIAASLDICSRNCPYSLRNCNAHGFLGEKASQNHLTKSEGA